MKPSIEEIAAAYRAACHDSAIDYMIDQRTDKDGYRVCVRHEDRSRRVHEERESAVDELIRYRVITAAVALGYDRAEVTAYCESYRGPHPRMGDMVLDRFVDDSERANACAPLVDAEPIDLADPTQRRNVLAEVVPVVRDILEDEDAPSVDAIALIVTNGLAADNQIITDHDALISLISDTLYTLTAVGN